ncbi:hypothetical protein JN535_16635 [Cellulosimicrobium cellulans]|uniref:hypothetical protein n=1 Tax=Cellulosimicrobium cellulans TaxID=1710 RepID=UPI00196384A6|nr:hypothetical protein [Cellulosimicrobium cellulans]MBN0041789.1 hypothetical protein [Cellulosimicrobium cellulans]
MPTTPTASNGISNVPRHPGPSVAADGPPVPRDARLRVPRWSVPLVAAAVAAVVLLVVEHLAVGTTLALGLRR